MATQGTEARYSKVAIALHWIIALALAGQMALGFTMPRDASGFELYQLHKSIGIAILLLSLLRLAWRLTHRMPVTTEGGFTGLLARAVHVLLYAFMILTPLTGWALVSSAEMDVPTYLFGLVPWPDLPVATSLEESFMEAHEILAWLGIGLFVLHVAGALRHHLLLRDDLLGRMAPGGRPLAALLLAGAVVALGGTVFAAIGLADDEHDHATDHAPGAEDHEHDSTSEDPDSATGEEAEHDHATHEHDEEAGAGEEEEAVEEPAAASPAAAGPPPQWTIQPGGDLRFSVSNSGAQIAGSFSQWSGRIAFDPDNPQTADISITVPLASARIGDATQDGMLQGADFFSTSSFPTATWRSTSVTALGGGRYRANGTLSLRGASRAQTVNFALSGTGNRRSVTGTATIDRNAFGVGQGDSATNLGGNVALSFSFEATR